MEMQNVTVIVKEDEIRSIHTDSEKGCNDLLKLSDFFTNNIADEFLKITSLSLTNCNLTELPPVVDRLNLKRLNLSGNQFTEVPIVLYLNFEALEVLDLSHNFIKTFEIEPACCLVLRVLKLQNNKIFNLPQWILVGRCPHLVELVYSCNKVTVLKTSQELKIKQLEMCNVGLRDCDFTFLKKIKTLEHLDVGNLESSANENKFQDIDNLFVRPKWDGLQVLKMNNFPMAILSPGVFWVTTLVELHVVNCCLSWLTLDIQYLVNLQVLDITNNSICSLPLELTGLEQLKVVKAAQNQIALVAKFVAKLEILDLYYNDLETFPDGLEEIPLIDLEQNFFDSDDYENKEYEEKRDRLRGILEVDRYLGPRPTISWSLSRSSFSEDSYNESNEPITYDDSELEENWDDDDPPNKIYQRSPEIASSDEEWCGKEEPAKAKKLGKTKVYINEDYLFCDAD